MLTTGMVNNIQYYIFNSNIKCYGMYIFSHIDLE